MANEKLSYRELNSEEDTESDDELDILDLDASFDYDGLLDDPIPTSKSDKVEMNLTAKRKARPIVYGFLERENRCKRRKIGWDVLVSGSERSIFDDVVRKILMTRKRN